MIKRTLLHLQPRTARGGAIYLYMKSKAVISNSSLVGNTATNLGGAIYIQAGSSVTLKDTNIEFNTAALKGGGISMDLDDGECILFKSKRGCYISE